MKKDELLVANPYQQAYTNYGTAFGINPQVLQYIGQFESNHNPNAVNNWDSNAKAGIPSQGIMQYIQPTFNSFYDQAAAARPDLFQSLGPKDWMNPEQQIATTAWALSQGKGGHWATYDRALSQAGGKLRVPQGQFALESSQNAIQGPLKADTKKLKALNELAEWDPVKYGYKRDKYLASMQQAPQQQAAAPDNPYMPQGGSVMDRMQSFIKQFGIQFDSSAPWHQNPQQGGGQHTAGSHHYGGTAFDIGDARNNPQVLGRVSQYVKQNPQMFNEYFYDPLGWYVKGGKIKQGSIGGHGDHAHIAFME